MRRGGREKEEKSVRDAKRKGATVTEVGSDDAGGTEGMLAAGALLLYGYYTGGLKLYLSLSFAPSLPLSSFCESRRRSSTYRLASRI